MDPWLDVDSSSSSDGGDGRFELRTPAGPRELEATALKDEGSVEDDEPVIWRGWREGIAEVDAADEDDWKVG